MEPILVIEVVEIESQIESMGEKIETAKPKVDL